MLSSKTDFCNRSELPVRSLLKWSGLLFVASVAGCSSLSRSPSSELVTDNPRVASGSGPTSRADNAPICLIDHLSSARTQQQAARRSSPRLDAEPYRGFQDAFAAAGIQSEEQLARLVYAETLASKCEPQLLPSVARIIAGVLEERISRRADKGFAHAVNSVVYQDRQFASTLHFYRFEGCPSRKAKEQVPGVVTQSRPDYFLCPFANESREGPQIDPINKTHAQLFAHIRSLTRAIENRIGNRATERSEKRSKSDAGTHYYLNKHSPCWPNPPSSWREPKMRDLSNELSPELAACLGVWSEPAWR